MSDGEKPTRDLRVCGRDGVSNMKRTAFALFIVLIIVTIAVIAGCGSGGDSSQENGGDGGGGKAQALVFTQPG
jgi:hypothetical protein